MTTEAISIPEPMAAFFDARAIGYDDHMRKNVFTATTFVHFYDAIAGQIPETNDALQILDLGCGTGFEIEPLLQRAPNALITAVDLSEEMLALLADRYQAHRDQIGTTMSTQTAIHPVPLSDKIITKTITINAPPATVWAALTEPAIMQQWMAEEKIEILTDWQIGQPFLIRGHLHWVKFENRGQVLQFQPERLLQYTHLSSLSRLPDEPASYTTVEFRLALVAAQTTLTLTVWNFPTEAIYKHLAFYWPVALGMVKKRLEQPTPAFASV